MNSEPTQVERRALGIVAAIAVLTFFFPLVYLHVPLAPDQEISGYDMISNMRQFSQQIGGASPKVDASDGAATPSIPAGKESTLTGSPLSLRLAWLIPVSILGSLFCAGLTLVGYFLGVRLAKWGSTVGAVLGIGSILHITILNSDVRAMMQHAMTPVAELKDNPFAALAQGLGSLVVNAFRFAPGTGLWVLTSCLVVAAIISRRLSIRPLESAPSRLKALPEPIQIGLRPSRVRFYSQLRTISPAGWLGIGALAFVVGGALAKLTPQSNSGNGATEKRVQTTKDNTPVDRLTVSPVVSSLRSELGNDVAHLPSCLTAERPGRLYDAEGLCDSSYIRVMLLGGKLWTVTVVYSRQTHQGSPISENVTLPQAIKLHSLQPGLATPRFGRLEAMPSLPGGGLVDLSNRIIYFTETSDTQSLVRDVEYSGRPLQFTGGTSGELNLLTGEEDKALTALARAEARP
jgi:hypothetical protein